MLRLRLCLASLAGLLALACGQDRRALVPPPVESEHQSLIVQITNGTSKVTRAVALGSATWPQDFSLPNFGGLDDATIDAFAYAASLAELKLEEGVVLEPAQSAPCERGTPDKIWRADHDAATGWLEVSIEQVDLTPVLGTLPCDRNTNCRELDNPIIQLIADKPGVEALEVISPGRFLVSSRSGGAWEVGPNFPAQRLPQFDGWQSFGSVTAPDGKIWLGGTNGRIRIVDPQTLTSSITQVPTDKRIANISFSPSGKVLALATNLGMQEEPPPRFELEILLRIGTTWQSLLRFETVKTSYTQASSAWVNDEEALVSHGGIEGVRINGTIARIDDTLSFSQAFARSGAHMYMGLREAGVFRLRADGTWEELVRRVVGRGPEGFLALEEGLMVGQECGYFFEVLPNGTTCSPKRFQDIDVEIIRRDNQGTLAFAGGTIYDEGTPIVFLENAL